MPKLSIVIPTYNESGNVPVLVSRLHPCSPPQVSIGKPSSSTTTRSTALPASFGDRRPRPPRPPHPSHRPPRPLLGLRRRHALLLRPFIAVMDADLQHDETVLPAMLNKLENDSSTLSSLPVTRPAAAWANSPRARPTQQSRKKLAAVVCHANVSDPMSGFFALRASYLLEVVHHLSQSGFKILVDLLASARRPVALGEIPYTFRSRLTGESKLDSSVLVSYLYLLADQLFGRWLPLRFVLFCLVGAGGVLLHLFCLYTGLQLGLHFSAAVIIATVVAMTANYVVNNVFTFVDRKRKGVQWFTGLLLWYAACAIGVFLNLRVADTLYAHNLGWLIPGIAGLTVAAVWNFAVTNVMVWRSKMKRANERTRLHLTRSAHA